MSLFDELLKKRPKIEAEAGCGYKLVTDQKPDSKFAVQCDFCKKWAENEKKLIEHRDIHVSLILPYLYLGNQENAYEKKMLQDIGIKRILNVADDAECRWKKDFTYLHLKLDDVENQSIRPFFQQAFEFIDNGRDTKESVLVHCVQGISRSASFIIAYIMQKEKWTLEKSIQHAKTARSIVNPNRGFQAQLCEYEKELYKLEESTLRLAPWNSTTTSFSPKGPFVILSSSTSSSSTTTTPTTTPTTTTTTVSSLES